MLPGMDTHPLSIWCAQTERSLVSVARDLDISRETLRRWMTGVTAISVYDAGRVRDLTAGFVRLDSWPVPTRATT